MMVIICAQALPLDWDVNGIARGNEKKKMCSGLSISCLKLCAWHREQ